MCGENRVLRNRESETILNKTISNTLLFAFFFNINHLYLKKGNHFCYQSQHLSSLCKFQCIMHTISHKILLCNLYTGCSDLWT